MSVRVYQLSKEIGMENQQLIEILRARNYDIKSASSTIDNISAESIREEFGKKGAEATEAAAQPKSEPKTADSAAKEEAAVVEKPQETAPSAPEAEATPAPKTAVAAPKPAASAPSAPPVPSIPTPPAPPPIPRGAPPVAVPRGISSPPATPSPRGVSAPPSVAVPPAGASIKPAFPVGAIVRTKEEIEKERAARLEEQRKNAIVSAPQPVVRPNVVTSTPKPAASPAALAPRTPAAPVTPPPVVRGPSPVVPPVAPPITLPRASTGPGIAVPGASGPATPPAPPRVSSPASAPAQPISTPEPVTPASEESKPAEAGDPTLLVVKPPIIVRDFAAQIGLRPFQLISELMDMGIFASMNQILENDVASRIAAKHNFVLEIRHRGENQQQQQQKAKDEPEIDESALMEPRPPVVCIMGHVDHGKTTLLDTIRKTNVVASEAGGITQHIGSYQIEHEGKKITFIDTPGHSAFANMRARGASVTDIAILVVAADDGFMPQTDEALKHARKANVPIVVAINKIDSKGANIDRVKQQLQERDLMPEDWGGETLCVGVSALNGTNIDKLLEAILLQAEIMDNIKANPKCPAEGIIIEAQKEVGLGSTASVIIQKGTLRPGESLVSGQYYCRARQLIGDNGKPLKIATPSTPVKIIGWSDTPESGQRFVAVKNERVAREMAEEAEFQLKKQRTSEPEFKATSVAQLLFAIANQKSKTFKVIVKADVYGTAEALGVALEQIKSTKITLEVVNVGVGPITKNDVLMAHAAQAALVAFDVGLDNGVAPVAKHHGVTIYQHNIIYELIDIVKDAMADQLDPELKEVKLGAAEVRAIFPLAKGFVAGCMVTEGRIQRDGRVRVLRKGKVEFENNVAALKRFKDDVSEVRSGFECGISVASYNGYQIGDVIECFEIQKIKPTL